MKTELVDEPAAFPGSPTSKEIVHIISKFYQSLFLIEKKWSEFKVVQFWQPTNHNNIGAASVCRSGCSAQNRVLASAFLPVCACVHLPTMREFSLP